MTDKTFGTIPESYEICYSEELKENESVGVVLRHKKSGARVCLVSNDEENKVFCIGFRTTPLNSTGVPHIIEHSVLCGSKKYPVKDPFIELAKSSLNTFLNAMTYPDKTLYPVASCNDKDIKNLMSVYMDAVFYPEIYRHPEIFKQEGWRYELESEDAELGINGVVYNEMKGAYSAASDYIEYCIGKHLFPDNTYGVSSGGDPDVIPELSYEEFLEFHKKYYHPSNSYIYLYGNFDMEERLEWLDKEYLCKFDSEETDSDIPLQKSLNGVKYVTDEYSIAEEDDEKEKTYLSYNVVTNDILDVKKTLALDCIHYALLGSAGAPIKQALIDAGIGKDILGDYNRYTRQPYLSIIAKDTEADRLEEFVKVIEDTLKEQVEKGINKDTLLAGINYLDFANREGDSGNFPKGLLYEINMFNSWLYDDTAAFSYCVMNPIFEELRKEIDTGYFEQLIKECILENKHKAVLTLKPVKGLNTKKEEALRDRLREYKESLSTEEIRKLVEDTAALRRYQEEGDSPEQIATLPKLSLEDVKKEAEKFNNRVSEEGRVKVIHHDIATNGIAYYNLLFDIEGIREEYWQYASLAVKLIGYRLNTAKHTHIELNNEIAKYAGGIWTSEDTYSIYGNPNEYKAYVFLGVKALVENVPKVTELITEIMLESDFDDKKRFKEILGQLVSGMQMALVRSGNSTALSRAKSYFSPVEYYEEKTGGISMYEFLKDIYNNFDEKADETISKMKKAISMVFVSDRMMVDVTSREDGLKAVKTEIPKIAAAIDASGNGNEPEVLGERKEFKPEALNEAFKISGQVQYAATAGNYRNSGFDYNGAMAVMKTILSYDYLWMNVRVKGGAYGCFYSYEVISGNCGIVSYRDPNLRSTYEVYKEAAEYIRNIELEPEEIEDYIIGTFSRMDMPRTPRSAGLYSLSGYISGLTDEFLQKERDEILGADLESIRNTADILDCVNQGYICTVGTEAKCTQDAALFKSIKTLS